MPTLPAPTVGEVWDLSLDPGIGREQHGYRPALVISNDDFNQLPKGLHFVVPVTGTDRELRFHIVIDPPEGGLKKTSVLMCDQARSLSIERFRRRRGLVSPDTLRRVQAMVGQFVDR